MVSGTNVLEATGRVCERDLAGFVPEGPDPVRRPFVDFEYVGSGDRDRWSASAVILERLGCPDHRSVGLDMPRAGPKRSNSIRVLVYFDYGCPTYGDTGQHAAVISKGAG